MAARHILILQALFGHPSYLLSYFLDTVSQVQSHPVITVSVYRYIPAYTQEIYKAGSTLPVKFSGE